MTLRLRETPLSLFNGNLCDLIDEYMLDGLTGAELVTVLEKHCDELRAGYTPEPPEPCTSAAAAAGCTCSMTQTHSASIDPPEPIIDRWCPLHGSKEDPDHGWEARRDDREVHGFDDRIIDEGDEP